MVRRYVGIDPSTKTGLVILDATGSILEKQEIVTDLDGKAPDPLNMRKLIGRVTARVQPGDVVAIEGFGFASQSGFLLGGIGWGIRLQLYGKGIRYTDVAPSSLKKFTGAGGNASKEAVAVETYKRWAFQSSSNNVTDAFVLAQITRALHEPVRLIKCQEEVITKLRG